MFAFYDLETTGISPAFDQPLQFAAILCDDDLQPVERVNLRCRLAPHILPSPGALAVTGVAPGQITDPSLPSWFELTGQIRDLVSRWAPATWTGFNSLKFDDRMMRQSFYQTLQPEIYAMQFDGNTRLDVMTSLYGVFARSPGALTWPRNAAGKLSFRLEDLAPANGFAGHDAHDALGDVEATIHLARLIRERAPRVWHEMLLNRDKTHVGDLIRSGEPLMLVQRFGGPPKAHVGCGCGFQANYANHGCFIDLDAVDPAAFLEADDAALLALVRRSPRVVRTVSINATPILFRHPEAEPLIHERAALVASSPEFRLRIGRLVAQYMAETYPPAAPDEEVRVESRIYDGFYSHADKRLLNEFSLADWPERLTLIERFEDLRLRQLGLRLAVFECPGLLPADKVRSAARNILAKWDAEEVPKDGWTTLSSVSLEIAELEAAGALTADAAAELREFYRARRAAMAAGRIGEGA